MEKSSEVAVIGAGIMGRGIAQLCAQSGFFVSLVDLDDEILSQGIGEIQSAIQRMVDKGKISSEEAGKVLGRIKGVTDLDDAAADADLVIEAVPENMGLKSRLFRDIAKICRSNVILATNTSSLSRYSLPVPLFFALLSLIVFLPCLSRQELDRFRYSYIRIGIM